MDLKKDAIINLLFGLIPISILAGFVVFHFLFKKEDVVSFKAKSYISNIEIAISKFKDDNGRCPNNEEGLLALIKNPGLEEWNGPYINSDQLNDPWGLPYKYDFVQQEEGRIVIFIGSSGKNRIWETTKNGLLGEKAEGDDIIGIVAEECGRIGIR